MSTPHFVDGAPANLEAAAMDALDWLRWTRNNAALGPKNMARIQAAIRALETHLPTDEPIFEEKQHEDVSN